MARTPDSKSVRQQAFKMLDGMRNFKRKTAIAKIKAKFNLGDRYADTLYATHREMGKEAGLYTTTYRVLDMRNGKSVRPYMSTHIVYRPKKSDFLSAEAARQAYLQSLEEKVSVARSLGA